MKTAYSNQDKRHIVGSTLSEEVHREVRKGYVIPETRGNYVAICGQSLDGAYSTGDPMIDHFPEAFGNREGDCQSCARSLQTREDI